MGEEAQSESEEEVNKREMLRMTAVLDQHRAELKDIGKSVSVSEMELVALVNLAEVGVMSVFSQLDGSTGEKAAAELNEHLDAIRATFATKEDSDGLTRLMTSVAAMVRGERFGKYLV